MSEGAFKDVEQLAIFLACSTKVDRMPETRLEMLEFWESKDESKRAGYRRRAQRLLRTWAAQ